MVIALVNIGAALIRSTSYTSFDSVCIAKQQLMDRNLNCNIPLLDSFQNKNLSNVIYNNRKPEMVEILLVFVVAAMAIAVRTIARAQILGILGKLPK